MTDFNKIFAEKYNQLNSEQKRAVDTIEGPVMVLAGPGTGKTQILALRIAKILKETQVDPYNILCLTFTENGASEMRKRLTEFIGPASYYVRITTFHSFCNDIIREFPDKFAFKRELELLSDVERVKFFREIADDLAVDSILRPFNEPYLYLRDFVNLIKTLKMEGVSISDYKKLVFDVSEFLKLLESPLSDFSEINGHKLTDSDVMNFFNEFSEISSKSDGGKVMFDFLATKFKKYFEESLEDKKEQKKLRTKFKNEIKSFYQEITNNFPKQKELAFIYEKYQKKLVERGRYDYEDMLILVSQKLKEDAFLRTKYQEQFQYILVDEYQDTNGVQNETVKILCSFGPKPNVFVVGDDKQSIYRFQGASMENIVYFYKLYEKDIAVIKLKENYRSTQPILDATQFLIDHNSKNIDAFISNTSLSLNSNSKSESVLIELCEFENPSNEIYFLAKKIQELMKNGVDPREIAVLFRNNRDVKEIVSLFSRMQIPFRLEAGENILDDSQIMKFIELLRFISNMTDSSNLFYILHYDFLNFSSFDTAKISYFAGMKRIGFFEIISNSDLLSEAGIKDVNSFLEFSMKLATWQGDSVNMPFTYFFDKVLKESGFMSYLINDPEKLEHLNRMNTLFAEINKINRGNPNFHLNEFLEHLDLLSENGIILESNSLQTKKESVALMTVHKSKGLEFEHVFIIKCVDRHFGNIPSRDKIKLPLGVIKDDISRNVIEKNEDERRLFYVAMTRAKRQIYLSYSRFNENQRAQTPSLFVAEIDEKFIERIDTKEIEDEALERLQTAFLELPKENILPQVYLGTLLKDYSLSPTHLNDYLRCARLFYYRHVLKAPLPKVKAQIFGTAVHEALKDFFASYKIGDLPSQEYLIDRFKFYLQKEILLKKDFDEILEFGTKVLKEYYEGNKNKFIKNCFTELNFRTHKVLLDNVPLNGKIDKVEIIDDVKKIANIIDYKVSSPDSKFQELAIDGEYRRQLKFYQLLCDLSKQFHYKMLSGEIDFILKSKKDGSYKRSHFEFPMDELNDFKDLIKMVYKDIISLKFEKTEDWSQCEKCSFKNVCWKSGKEKDKFLPLYKGEGDNILH